MDNEKKPLLSIRNLKTYFKMDEGTSQAVDGVSFDVHEGQVVGVVGESGCGKSVTIKSVLRIVQKPGQIVEGEILWRHQLVGGQDELIDLAQLDAQGKQMRSIRGGEIALIPQEPMAAFSPVHTIGNQLVEAVQLHIKVNKREAKRIAIERLREVGMPSPEQRMDAYSWELSGGLRQRAMIAMALSCNPRLLIADEPTTAIDVTTQAQVLNLLRGLQQEHNMSIIFITHDLGVIAQVADYVVVMYLGRIVEEAATADLFARPRHPYTEALMTSVLTPDPRLGLPETHLGIAYPNPIDPPPGCTFHPRCAYAQARCSIDAPQLASSDGRKVSCHFPLG